MNGTPPVSSIKTVLSLPIEGMTCASCVLRVEKTLKKVGGVSQATVNLATNRAMVEYDPSQTSVDALHDAVRDAGYTLLLPSPENTNKATRPENTIEERAASHARKDFLTSLILTVPVMLISMISMTTWFHEHAPLTMDEANIILFFLTTMLLFGPGRRFFIGLWTAIRHLSADMNALVAVGAGAAYLFSAYMTLHPGSSGSGSQALYFDTSATIITLILLGKMLESRAKHRASNAIRMLIGLQPDTARVRRFGKEIDIPITDVVVDDVVMIRPGERIPLDGIVTNGETTIDESMLTGESFPVMKHAGSAIVGGTMNKNGSMEFRATAVGRDTVLAHIIRLVETAQGSKAPVQFLADKIASVFVPAVILISIITFGIWLITGAVFTTALMNAIAVLVIACPCALGLATPTAIIVGVGVGAEHGILIRNAASLERAHSATDVVFDKTGTLTEGSPRVTSLQVCGAFDEKTLLSLTASLEHLSGHPLAFAVLEEAKQRGIGPAGAESFRNYPGLGVAGVVDGNAVLAGNEEMMKEFSINVSELLADAKQCAVHGATIAYVAVNGAAAGFFAISDPLRSTSREAVAALRKMKRTVTLLTGDTLEAASVIAAEAGIDHVIARILPQDKAAHIAALQSQGRIVAMAGDGINDAPALAQADVSIAMGGGTDVAMETADITLMKNDLMHVVHAIRLSEKTLQKIRQNLFWAFIYNVIGIPLAAFGLLNPMIAAAAMAFSSVSVVSNSLLLKRLKFHSK